MMVLKNLTLVLIIRLGDAQMFFFLRKATLTLLITGLNANLLHTPPPPPNPHPPPTCPCKNQSLDSFEPISFKLSMMINISKLYSLLLVNDLDPHLRSKGYAECRTCAVKLVKWHEIAKTFVMIDSVRKGSLVNTANMDHLSICSFFLNCDILWCACRLVKKGHLCLWTSWATCIYQYSIVGGLVTYMVLELYSHVYRSFVCCCKPVSSSFRCVHWLASLLIWQADWFVGFYLFVSLV